MIQLTDGTKILFSPEDDTQAEYISLLTNATKRIYVADYSFNIPQVVDILIQKYKDGIDVKLVLDNSQSKGKTEVPEVQQLRDAKVPTVIVESDEHRIMHNKFSVIDDITQAGSWNYTTAASQENNFYFVLDNSLVTNAFLQVFNDMYAGKTTVIKETIN